MSFLQASILAFGLFIFGGEQFIGGLFLLKRKRLIKNTPTSRANSAAMGAVELAGSAAPHTPQKAPVSGASCCLWECDVQEFIPNKKGGGRWATFFQKRSTGYFYLEDPTGKILINPYGAEFDIRHYQMILDDGTRAQMAPVLEGWGIDITDWFGGMRQLAVLEKTIPVGAALYVMGELVTNKTSSDNLQERFRQLLQRIKADKERLAEADTNQDRSIDGMEWDAFRQKIETEFYQEERARMEETPEVILVTAPKDGPFLIATKNEKQFLGKYAGAEPWMIGGGIFLNCLGVFFAILGDWDPLYIGIVLLAVLIFFSLRHAGSRTT